VTPSKDGGLHGGEPYYSKGERYGGGIVIQVSAELFYLLNFQRCKGWTLRLKGLDAVPKPRKGGPERFKIA